MKHVYHFTPQTQGWETFAISLTSWIFCWWFNRLCDPLSYYPNFTFTLHMCFNFCTESTLFLLDSLFIIYFKVTTAMSFKNFSEVFGLIIHNYIICFLIFMLGLDKRSVKGNFFYVESHVWFMLHNLREKNLLTFLLTKILQPTVDYIYNILFKNYNIISLFPDAEYF